MNRFFRGLEALSIILLILAAVESTYHGSGRPLMLDDPVISLIAVLSLIESFFDIRHKSRNRCGGKGDG